MTPADLKNPFGESCCDGGECSIKESARSCGCDPGINWFCQYHSYKEALQSLIKKWEVLLKDPTITNPTAGILSHCIDDVQELIDK